METPIVVIEISGGMVSEIYSTDRVEILVIDKDAEKVGGYPFEFPAPIVSPKSVKKLLQKARNEND